MTINLIFSVLQPIMKLLQEDGFIQSDLLCQLWQYDQSVAANFL